MCGVTWGTCSGQPRKVKVMGSNTLCSNSNDPYKHGHEWNVLQESLHNLLHCATFVKPASATATAEPTTALFFTSLMLDSKLLPPVSSRMRSSKKGVTCATSDTSGTFVVG